MKRTLTENMELLMEIAADMEFSPEYLYRGVQAAKPGSLSASVAERAIEELDLRAEPEWTNRERAT